MKRYAKVVQSDERGQIVIPKDIRLELGLERGAAFAIYLIEQEGLFLKPVSVPDLGQHGRVLDDLRKHADTLKIKKKNIDKSVAKYKRVTLTNMEEVH